VSVRWNDIFWFHEQTEVGAWSRKGQR
jgi:hypothetical protein